MSQSAVHIAGTLESSNDDAESDGRGGSAKLPVYHDIVNVEHGKRLADEKRSYQEQQEPWFEQCMEVGIHLVVMLDLGFSRGQRVDCKYSYDAENHEQDPQCDTENL